MISFHKIESEYIKRFEELKNMFLVKNGIIDKKNYVTNILRIFINILEITINYLKILKIQKIF